MSHISYIEGQEGQVESGLMQNGKHACGVKLQSYLFLLPLENLHFLLLHWSGLNSWLVWRIRPTLQSGGKDKYRLMILVLG